MPAMSNMKFCYIANQYFMMTGACTLKR